MTMARSWAWRRVDELRTALDALILTLNLRLPALGQLVTQLLGLQPWVDIKDHGAIGDGDTARAAANVVAIREAMARCLLERRTLYFSDGIFRHNDNFTFDGEWSGLSVIFSPGCWLKAADALDEATNVEAGWTIILDGASNGALTDFAVYRPQIDGNRTGIVGFDPGNTTVGVVGYQDSDFTNVRVIGGTVKSQFQGTGFFTYAAGIRFIDCEAYDNDYHGGAASRSTTFGDEDKVTEWTNFTSHHNAQGLFDGCGLDVGRYCRCVVTNLNSHWNGQGMKFSIGTKFLKVRGAVLAHNVYNGFQDTDTVGTAILDLDGIVTHHNGGLGLRLVSGQNVRLGSITSYDNYCAVSGHSRDTATYTAWATATAYVVGNVRTLRNINYYCTVAHTSGTTTEPGIGSDWRGVWREQWFTGGVLSGGGDIQIGTSTSVLSAFTADSLRTIRSPINGVFVDGNVQNYRIGYLEAVTCQGAGFYEVLSGSWATATAYIVGDVRLNGGVAYVCTLAHTSGAGTEPGVGGSWTTAWRVTALSGAVESMLLVENNNVGTATSAAACAVICERPGALAIGRAQFRDNRATPTQHSGMYFSSGLRATIGAAEFGPGITNQYFTASAGTTIRHENTWGAVRAVSASTTLEHTDETVLADATSGAITLTLKAATNMTGKRYIVKKIDASANAVTLDASGAETIDGAATYALAAPYEAVTLQSDGAAWWIQQKTALVIENRTSDPASPVTGQLWLRTDL